MSKRLNLHKIEDSMFKKGLSQQAIAERIGVTRAAVSGWLKPEKFPRPNHLFKLAEILGLNFNELVISEDNNLNAKVAFRKSGNYQITDGDLRQFQYVSTLLGSIVEYSNIDTLSKPPTLNNPNSNYAYIQKVAANVRNEINPKDGIITFGDLIGLFKTLHATLIPVLWGEKSKKHGTHILLPDSNTTWVFINLDSKAFDFLFWLAHELGHAKAPFMEYEAGEEFADNFAGALLFPKEFAEKYYEILIKEKDLWARTNTILDISKKFIISPITIYKEIEKHARENGLESLALETDKIIWRGTSNFHKDFKTLSEIIFKENVPETKEYIEACSKHFDSDFFSMLKVYINKHDSASPKFVADILDISIIDANEIWQELIADGPK